MPGTGSLRRSSAPVRKKAIVDKSRIGAGALRSPRFIFLALLKIIFSCVDLEGIKSRSKLDCELRRGACPIDRRFLPLFSDIA